MSEEYKYDLLPRVAKPKLTPKKIQKLRLLYRTIFENTLNDMLKYITSLPNTHQELKKPYNNIKKFRDKINHRKFNIIENQILYDTITYAIQLESELKYEIKLLNLNYNMKYKLFHLDSRIFNWYQQMNRM